MQQTKFRIEKTWPDRECNERRERLADGQEHVVANTVYVEFLVSAAVEFPVETDLNRTPAERAEATAENRKGALDQLRSDIGALNWAGREPVYHGPGA
jgi:hypothetical protein